jgi:hypothetical protein
MNERDDVAIEDALVNKAQQLFDESVNGLDEATCSRLNRGRQAALSEVSGGARRFNQWIPAGGVAAAAIVLMVVWNGNQQLDIPQVPEVATDMEILLNEDSLEMIEDLEFYSWIDLDAEIGGDLEPVNNVG